MKSDQSPNQPITLVYLRERIGKSQFEMAVALNKTPGTVSNWERGLKTPIFETPTQVKEVMTAYQCSFAEFLEAFGNTHFKISLVELNKLLARGNFSLEEWIEESEVD